METTTKSVSVEHPYLGVGIVIMIISLVLIAFGIGVLARCGGGEGVCFDVASHSTSDGALIGFFVLFVLGAALALYTSGSVSVSRSESPRSPPQVMVVAPSAAPSPPPANITINTPSASPPPTTVTVSTPR